jgi:uncharacterized protein with PQ loop repeat
LKFFFGKSTNHSNSVSKGALYELNRDSFLIMFHYLDPMVTTDPTRTVLANVAGSTSLACWVVLLLPQLIEQWRLKSADGISIGFLSIWLLGDITNLLGALWAQLQPGVIFLAIWYCIADSLIFFSYFYYKRLAQRRREKKALRRASRESARRQSEDPQAPLLDRRNSARRHSHGYSHRRDSISSFLAPEANKTNVWTQFVLPILFVLATGALGYFVTGDGSSDQPDTGPQPDKPMELGPQVLGYISASLYLGARIPQILQNHRRKSVEGLSLLFFIFSLLGNITYAAQILIQRSDWPWIVLNFSWLLGSLGTIVEDAFIFFQFYLYRGNHHGKDHAVV